MASSKEYLDFVMDQLSSLNGISYKSMMGEYIIYYRGKMNYLFASSACYGCNLDLFTIQQYNGFRERKRIGRE